MRTMSMPSIKRRVNHASRSSHKFAFAVHAVDVEGLGSPAQGLPDGAQAVLRFSRGNKVVTSPAAPIMLGKASWESLRPLEWVCTLYASKKSEKAFSEKAFRVSLLLCTEGGRKGQKTTEIASADLDVSSFASTEQITERRLNYTIVLAPRTGKASRGALASEADPVEVRTTIATTFLKDLAVDPDEESMSSAVPSHASGARRAGAIAPSGARRADDHLEQDLQGFEDGDDDDMKSESGSSASWADPVRSHSSASQPPDALARQFAAQAAALSSATAQLAELKEELEATRRGETERKRLGSLPQATVISRTPPPLLASKSVEAKRALEAEVEALKAELHQAHERHAKEKVLREAAEARAARLIDESLPLTFPQPSPHAP